MSWLQNFLDNTIVQAVLAIIAIAGFGWGFYSHSYSNKKQRISTAFSAYEIIKQGKNTIEQLSLSFAGKEIHDLTVTKFAIWNSGNKVINGSDVVPSQKLRVIADESSEILEAQIVIESDSSNCFKIAEVTNKRVSLDFDYVDSREGIVLQVFHTGTEESLKIECKIKGGKQIKNLNADRKRRRKSPRFRRASKKIMAIVMMVEVVLMLALSVIVYLVELEVIPKSFLSSPLIVPQNKTLTLMMLGVSVIPMIYVSLKILRNAFGIGVPVKLKSFGNTFDNM